MLGLNTNSKFSFRTRAAASQFLSHRRAKPDAKLQAPEKLQISNTKPQYQMPGQTAHRSVFELGAWCFFGAWSLEFGVWRPGNLIPITPLRRSSVVNTPPAPL